MSTSPSPEDTEPTPGPSRWFLLFCWIVWPLQALFAAVVTPPPPPDLRDGRARILVANHRSLFDVMIGVTLLRRWRFPTAFLVNARYFDRPLLRVPLRMIGAVPVDQDRPRAALRDAISLLERGVSVLIMPEGRICPVGTPADALLTVGPGAAMLASRTGADLIVGGIHGADQVWPADAPRPVTRPGRRGRVTLTIETLSVEPGEGRRQLNDRIEAAMQRQLGRAVALGGGDVRNTAGSSAVPLCDPQRAHPEQM